MFWGLLSQLQVLKIEVLSVGFKPFVPQGEKLLIEFTPDCGALLYEWRLW